MVTRSSAALAAGVLALAGCFLLAGSSLRSPRTIAIHRDARGGAAQRGGALPPWLPAAATPQGLRDMAGYGGLAPSQPSLASFKRVQAISARTAGHSTDVVDPQLANLTREFAAAPWLLPCRTAALPYAGVHDFDTLLSLRSAPLGPYNRSIALLLFDRSRATFTQNAVYSMVKMGGVQNYMMLTWTASDLVACLDLNLPCANVTRWLLRRTRAGQEAALGSQDFNVINWLKPRAMLRAARQGHAVLMLDTDVAFTVKPAWSSLLAYTEQGGADGAWQHAPAMVGNTGFVFLRPTPGALAYLNGWNEIAPCMLAARVSEQKAQPILLGNIMQSCYTPCSCQRISYELTQQHTRHEVGVMRYFLASSWAEGNCALATDPLWLSRMDPCDFSVLFVHPICTTGDDAAQHKRLGLEAAGFWFMDDEKGCPPQPGSPSKVPSCRPLEWRVPGTEAPHYSCPSYGLALVHGGEAPGIAALRDGTVAPEELEKSFKERPC